LGGAIFNEGILNINRSTLAGNLARGGNGGSSTVLCRNNGGAGGGGMAVTEEEAAVQTVQTVVRQMVERGLRLADREDWRPGRRGRRR